MTQFSKSQDDWLEHEHVADSHDVKYYLQVLVFDIQISQDLQFEQNELPYLLFGHAYQLTSLV